MRPQNELPRISDGSREEEGSGLEVGLWFGIYGTYNGNFAKFCEILRNAKFLGTQFLRLIGSSNLLVPCSFFLEVSSMEWNLGKDL